MTARRIGDVAMTDDVRRRWSSGQRDLAEEVAGAEARDVLAVVAHRRSTLDDHEELVGEIALVREFAPVLDVDLVDDATPSNLLAPAVTLADAAGTRRPAPGEL